MTSISAAQVVRRFAPRTPLSPPTDLTIPDAGSSTVRGLLNRYVAGVLGAFFSLPTARLSSARAAELDRVRQAVADVAAREPGAVVSLARWPTWSVLVRCASDELARGGQDPAVDGWIAELCAAALFELSLAGALDREISLDRPISRLSSLAHDLSLSAPARGARFGAGTVALALADGTVPVELDRPDASGRGPIEVTHPFPRIRGGIALAEVDNNPLSMNEAHPDKQGNAVDLGGRPAGEWTSVLGRAFDLVERYLPAIAAEMRLLLQQVVPVGHDAERHLSASYAEAIGTVYLSLHPNLLTMTEALVHEFQHNKINTLFFLDPVMRNAREPLFTSPVRPDPRPLHGVLLAVHAFQPVARLYEAMFAAADPLVQSPEVRRRFEQVVRINREGCEVLLPNARPTPVGLGVLDELRRWDGHFGPASDPGPGATLAGGGEHA